MNDILLITLFVIVFFVVMVLIWLVSRYKKLDSEYRVLSDHIERNNRDIAGLCSAAVSVDSKLIDSNNQLKEMVKKVSDFELNEQHTSQPYHSAIQKVRSGADVDELVGKCGLSREEALLLIRLHG